MGVGPRDCHVHEPPARRRRLRSALRGSVGVGDRSAGHRSSINRDHDPGDLGRSVSGQEEDRFGHVAGQPLALQWLVMLDGGAHVVAGDTGRDVSRRDAN